MSGGVGKHIGTLAISHFHGRRDASKTMRQPRSVPRAVDDAEVAALVIVAGMRVDDLAMPLPYRIYGAILGRAALMAAGQLGLSFGCQANQLEGAGYQATIASAFLRH